MPHLFESLHLRELTLAHRLVVSPMCQYSSVDGFADEWHFVHLGSRAVGGAALVFTEASAVTPEGRISPQDLGIWSDHHINGLARIVRFIHGQGTYAAMQIAHAGRKGSTVRPWEGHGAIPPSVGGRLRAAGASASLAVAGSPTAAEAGWQPVAPTDMPFADNYPVPRALSTEEIPAVVGAFHDAARRALSAGFDVLEIHAAHGYLIHQFLSPLINTRTDGYGGSFDNRVRLCLEIADAVRSVWPERLPLFVRVSATDWVPGGWDIEQAVELARRLRARGVDLIDCSSGGAVSHAQVPIGPGYQVPFAERIRREAGIATGAVGLITTPAQANAIVENGQADCVLLARELLRDPYWPLHAAIALGHHVPWPPQYLRAAPAEVPAR